jgi:hypothetical protein
MTVETRPSLTTMRSFAPDMELVLYSISDAALSLCFLFFLGLCFEYLSLLLCTFALVFCGFFALPGLLRIDQVFDLLFSLLQIALSAEIGLQANQNGICSRYAHARHVSTTIFETVHKGSEAFGWRRIVTRQGTQSSQLATFDANQAC